MCVWGGDKNKTKQEKSQLLQSSDWVKTEVIIRSALGIAGGTGCRNMQIKTQKYAGKDVGEMTKDL